jgi:hypothetical protein
VCIMEVREGQRSSTIAQAMAHNTSTIERDLDMFRPLLEARGETSLLAEIEAAQRALGVAYQHFLAVFAAEIERDVQHQHQPDAVIGAERVHVHASDAEFATAARVAEHRAERYETR